MTPSILVTAMNFAMQKHHGQTRRYTGEPYWNHCRAVADQVEAWGGTVDMQCAAYLHDTLEDTATSVEELLKVFGSTITGLVVELTDEFTHAKYPQLNRAARKRRESDRIGACSLEARVVKLADMADNTKTIEKFDPGFAWVYGAEKDYLLGLIGDALAEWRASRSNGAPAEHDAEPVHP